MDSIIKEGETVFHLFIPKSSGQVVDDVLAKGTRSKVWHGENLHIYLLARFRGLRNSDSHTSWQRKICQLSAICSVSPKELFQESDVKTNTGQDQHNYRPCKSILFTSSSDITSYSDGKCKLSKPIICKDGDIAFPLHVSMASLNVDTCRAQVTVSLWSSELKYLEDCQLVSKDWNDPSTIDFARTFIDDSPAPLMQSLTSAKKYQVNKAISIIPSPYISYRFAKAGPKHYLSLLVQNKSEEVIILDRLRVYCGYADNNQGENISDGSAIVEIRKISETENEDEEFPIVLQPLESHAFLFDIMIIDSSMEHTISQLPLLASLVWSAEPMIIQFETISTTYRLFEIGINWASVTTSAVLENTHVTIGDRFNIIYTINNGKHELENVSMKWEPESLTSSIDISIAPIKMAMGNSRSNGIVCLTPSIYLGNIPSWSSVTVSIDCLALKTGVHDIGKCIKLQYDCHESKENLDFKINLFHQPCRIYVLPSNVIASVSEAKTDTSKFNRQWSRESSASNYSLYGFGEYLRNRKRNENIVNTAGEYDNLKSPTINGEAHFYVAETPIETNDEDEISENSSTESKDTLNESTEIKVIVQESENGIGDGTDNTSTSENVAEIDDSNNQ